MDRITAMSSMHSPTLEKISLTSIPLWPYFLNLKGEGKAAPVFRSVRKVTGNGFPACSSSFGFGSKVSTWDAPPFRKKWMIRLAFGAKCGARGISGFNPSGAVAAVEKNSARLNAPMPMPQRQRNSRREVNSAASLLGIVFNLANKGSGCDSEVPLMRLDADLPRLPVVADPAY